MSDSPRCAPIDRSSRLKSQGSMGKVSRKFPQAKPTGAAFKAAAKRVMSKR